MIFINTMAFNKNYFYQHYGIQYELSLSTLWHLIRLIFVNTMALNKNAFYQYYGIQ